jgi:4-amino-4-deoxy-L-arabinose transferase-like glycosyltransferase
MLLIPLAVFIIAYHAFYKRPIPGGVGAHLLGLFVLAAVTLPWPLAVWRAMPEAPRLWFYESAGGLTDVMDNDRPWYYYVETFPQLPLPWTAALFAAMVLPFVRKSQTSPRRRLLQWLFPSVWLIGDLLLFSLSRQKKNAYLLPIAPAIALVVAQALVWVEARARLRRLTGWPGALVSVQTAVAVGFAAVTIYLLRTSPRPVALGTISRWVYVLLPWALVLLAIGPIWWTSRPRAWLRSAALAYAATIFVFSSFWYTDLDNARSPRLFAQAVGPMLVGPGRSVLLPVPPEAAYYMPLGLRYDPSAPEVFVVVDDRHHLSDAGAPFFEKKVGRRVASVERVVDGLPDNPRWRLFRIRLAPLVAEASR